MYLILLWLTHGIYSYVILDKFYLIFFVASCHGCMNYFLSAGTSMNGISFSKSCSSSVESESKKVMAFNEGMLLNYLEIDIVNYLLVCLVGKPKACLIECFFVFFGSWQVYQ